MPLGQIYESDLEKSRSEKIKSLGFLCYNLYVDGAMAFPEMNDHIGIIRGAMKSLMELRKDEINVASSKLQEINLDEKLLELGCICYNLYIDKKLFNNELLSICDSISEISKELRANELGIASEEPDNNCPYGMEPIPENYKKCKCGYRNRPIAKFCGKCGELLEV